MVSGVNVWKTPAIVFLVFPFIVTAEIFAQRRVAFEFGIRGGVPITIPLETRPTSTPGITVSESIDRSGFALGPTLGVVLYDRLIGQFDALYKPLGILSNTTSPVANIARKTDGGVWEFPLLFDYRFTARTVRPYVGGGVVLGQITTAITDSRGMFTSTGAESRNYNQFRLPEQHPAYVINAGLEWRASRIAIRPELRYTRWSDSLSDLKRKRYQFELLIGLTFR
ncbi:MAG: hypothetical protein HY646_18270 [Acidobacteria bacterium]|nr:hypothetical protein [Acidobacteriota bacterium]